MKDDPRGCDTCKLLAFQQQEPIAGAGGGEHLSAAGDGRRGFPLAAGGIVPARAEPGGGQPRAATVSNLSFAGWKGPLLAAALDLEGICASTGSACSSASLEPSHVLLAIGTSPESAHGSLRFSLGKWTTEADIDEVLEVLPRIVAKLRAISPLMKRN